ncbi:hypothetical protein JYK21_06660 [Ralstonia pickettii]|nr:hypothetical protein [Ralstonia pickettii]
MKLGLADSGESFRQPGRGFIGREEVFSLVEGGFVDVGEIRGEVRHVQLAGHGRVDRAVILGAVPLGHQADLLDALGERAGREDGFNGCFDCHRLIPPSR